MDSDITGPTFERVSDLVNEYARLVGRTHTEVAHALLSSNTLKKYGYSHEQKGHLTERQGRAAILLIDHWIGERFGTDKQG